MPGDPIVGYISLGRGITIHRERLSQRRRAQEGPRALHPGVLGRRRRDLLPGRDRGRRLGSPPAARGHVAHVRRGGHQHPRRPLHASTTRWSRTGSWSRSGTRARSTRRSAACATSTRCSTPTASPPGAASRVQRDRSRAAAVRVGDLGSRCDDRPLPGGRLAAIVLSCGRRTAAAAVDRCRTPFARRAGRATRTRRTCDVGSLVSATACPTRQGLISLGWTRKRSTCRRLARGPLPGLSSRPDVARLLPHPLGAGHLGDHLGRLGHVLAVGDLDADDAEHLVAEAGPGALEVGHLLGGEQDADARLAAAGQQREHVVGAERGELVDARSSRAGGRRAVSASR